MHRFQRPQYIGVFTLLDEGRRGPRPIAGEGHGKSQVSSALRVRGWSRVPCIHGGGGPFYVGREMSSG